jgi:hypothetical protein
MLRETRQKNLKSDKVALIQADVYDLSAVPGSFDAGMVGFWLSHVPRSRMFEFLAGFHSKLGSGSLVFMADNTFEEGRGGRLISEPGTRDTFKLRSLPDGSAYKVLKNYYHEPSLRKILSPLSTNLIVHEGKWFWWVSCQVA